MKDSELIKLATDFRVFAEVRAQSAEVALRAAEAAIMGGIKLLEIALATPGGFRVISDLRRRYGDRAWVGAGSVMNYEHIDRAIKSGAQFVTMPHTSPPLIEACRRSRVPPVAGALTPTEIAAAHSLGVPLVTLFPASSIGGRDYVTSVMSRMAGVRLIVAGGVGPENIVEYFNAGAAAISVGGSLFARGDLQNENYAAIAERARGMVRLAGMA
jgi:2-dehydro-3-deoxyphosphogluconate aldolase / (4S)-4-hydroxy-2-oxoglutarate aldolase